MTTLLLLPEDLYFEGDWIKFFASLKTRYMGRIIPVFCQHKAEAFAYLFCSKFLRQNLDAHNSAHPTKA